jgi:tol-pal system protein YbgF
LRVVKTLSFLEAEAALEVVSAGRGGRRPSIARAIAILALTVVSSGCFATRNDVRILQGDIFAMRAEAARADSARQRQIAELSTAIQASLRTVTDSVREVTNRLGRFQAEVRQDLEAIERQLLAMGELTGEAQRRILGLRADLEARATPPAPVQPPPTSPDSTQPPTTTAPAVTEGPNTLYMTGRNQASRGSYSAAREAFSEMLRQFPNSDLAPDAQLSLGDALQAEGRTTEADTAYQAVLTRYPTSTAAPTAQYKLALSLMQQGKRAEARAAMQRVVRNYPQSDASALATDWLSRNP